MSGALHDTLLNELQQAGLVQAEQPQPQEEVPKIDLSMVEKLASEVETLLSQVPAEEGAEPVDVHALLQERLNQVKTASAPAQDTNQAKRNLMAKLAQVVPGLETPQASTGERVRTVMNSWRAYFQEQGGAQ